MDSDLKDSNLTATWRRSSRGIHRDENSERLDLSLAGNLRLVGANEDVSQLLYLDLDSGEYRELAFEDWPDGFGGTAAFRKVSVEYATEHYQESESLIVEEKLADPEDSTDD